MTFYFPKFSFPNTFWDKFGPETSKYFVLNEARFIVVFKSADSEFDNFFF